MNRHHCQCNFNVYLIPNNTYSIHKITKIWEIYHMKWLHLNYNTYPVPRFKIY